MSHFDFLGTQLFRVDPLADSLMAWYLFTLAIKTEGLNHPKLKLMNKFAVSVASYPWRNVNTQLKHRLPHEIPADGNTQSESQINILQVVHAADRK